MTGGGDLASRTILETFTEHGLEATRTSMSFSRVPTFEEAEMVAKVASGAMDMSKWWLGDLILASEDMWGHKYAQLSAITSRSPEGLANIASVAKRVLREIRREGLSFSHHEAVASLSRERQVYWLGFAEEQRLDVHELRGLVRAEKDEAEKVHDGRELPRRRVVESKPKVWSPLEQAVADVLALPETLDGETCIPPDLLERLRAALAESP